jgi:hypothetical protein
MPSIESPEGLVDLGLRTIGEAEYERNLLKRFPGAVRLMDAVARRKRLLRALAGWRNSRPGPKEHRSQSFVALHSRSTQEAVSRLELGKVDPRLSTLEKYAAALGGNFFWQVVDDAGRPVSKDFTWDADVEYRRENPALPHMTESPPPGSSSPVAPKQSPQRVTSVAADVPASRPIKVGTPSSFSSERAWDPPRLTMLPGPETEKEADKKEEEEELLVLA